MAKKFTDKERAIAFFTTAPEAEVKDVLETVNVIARARGFAVGRKRAKTEPAKPAGTRKPRTAGASDGKKAADIAGAPPPQGNDAESGKQGAAAAGS